MSDATLHGFAYGEQLDTLAQRSLGYRLLAPGHPEPWSAEVEALARRLQAAPYPDPWPPTDLFCSVLLSDGRRLIALARYGLIDHTPAQRRGGLELVGVVGPAEVSVPAALAVYRWLRKRRAEAEDLHGLGDTFALADVVGAVPQTAVPTDPVPILPIRMWQEGALLFAATGPADADHHLGLLEQGAGGSWQWLPLVGADFPLQTYAQRGPLVAWTPHLAGVAVKLDQKRAEIQQRAPKEWRWRVATAAASWFLLVMLTLLNLTLTMMAWEDVHKKTLDPGSQPGAASSDKARQEGPQPTPADDSRDQFALQLYSLVSEHGGQAEWDQLQEQLLIRYDRAARDHQRLRLAESNVKGRAAVGAVSLLAERSAPRIEDAIRKALLQRGYDADLVEAACKRVREQLLAQAKKGP